MYIIPVPTLNVALFVDEGMEGRCLRLVLLLHQPDAEYAWASVQSRVVILGVTPGALVVGHKNLIIKHIKTPPNCKRAYRFLKGSIRRGGKFASWLREHQMDRTSIFAGSQS
jgi:hypothetical protein